MKKVLVIDAQGGGIGKLLVAEIVKKAIPAEIVAIGANSVATAAMLKAGATHGATGENPVLVGCKDADTIMGPIGIVMADAMYGEITPAMAEAIGQSKAQKILIPVNTCGSYVVGVENKSLKAYVEEAVTLLEKGLCE